MFSSSFCLAYGANRDMKERIWFCVVLVAFAGKAHSQTEFSDLPMGMESAVVDANAEFSEHIILKALDFDSNFQSFAIHIAEKNEFSDERFNGVVFRILRDSTREGQFDRKAVEIALRMLPLCTLDKDTRMRLLLDTYTAAIKNGSGARRAALTQLQKHPDELHDLVVERIQEDDFEISLLDFNLLNPNHERIHELLPIFMATAKSENEDRAAKGTVLTSELINRLKLRVSLTKAAGTLRDEGIDEQKITAAIGIFQRYDNNGDGRISQKEYSSTKNRTRVVGEDSDGDSFVSFRESVLTRPVAN